jgi:pantoate--beta-alanine ligase
MHVARTISAMKSLRASLPETVGFVPTMGYLHEGHISLVRQARSKNRSVVVSIFVNPTQFGPREDLARYPRDETRDLAMLEKAVTDIVFLPGAEEMYPPNYDTWVVVDKLTERLEGAVRPGHFKGVATICNKLFNIVAPQAAYFGQKDAQQVLVIKKMAADLNMRLDIVVLPTVREADGLAMSSRNAYLNPFERQAAGVLYRALQAAQKLWSNGERDAATARMQMTELISREPLARVDYISVANPETLAELEYLQASALVSLAVIIGKTRLIDNITLE